MVDGLIEAEETLTLEAGDENLFNGNTNALQWNSSNTIGGQSFDSKGNFTNERPAYIGLSHELAHAYDNILLGGMDTSYWWKDDEQFVTRADIFAGNIENYIRAEHGLNYRYSYFDNIQKPQA